MTQCLSCPPDGTESQRIENVKYTPNVEVGETFKITVSVATKIWFGSQYFRLCLFDGDTSIAYSDSIKIRSEETIDYIFKGTMPDKDLDLKVSLQLEAIGFVEYCQDARFITINRYIPGQPIADIAPTIDTDVAPAVRTDDIIIDDTDKDEDDKDEASLWEWLFGIKDDAEEGIEIVDWIMDNAVLILILVLVILLVIKFG